MHVIEEKDHRSRPTQVAQQDRESFADLHQGDVTPPRSPNRGSGAEQASEVVDESAAQPCHLIAGTSAQVAVEELGPKPERGRRAQQVTAGSQDRGTALITGEELSCEA
jgi:predicted transcriptional regulator